MRRLLTWLSRLLAAVAVIVVVLLAGTYFHLRGSLPEIDGHLSVTGLQSGVTIVRDRNGVPHIFGDTVEDAYYGLGFVHAQDRLWQMETVRRTGAGRLSEAVGAAALNWDRTARTLGIYRRAQDSFNALTPRSRGIVEAYVRGINTWLERYGDRLPPEFLVAGIKPEKWQPADVLVWGKLLGLSLDGNWRTELLRARLSRRLSEQQLLDLFPEYPPEAHTTLGAARQALNGLPLDRLYAETAAPFTQRMTASNEWVVAGNRTESGKPLLANDPHLGFEAPNTWYLARLVGPDMDIRGATAPGTPAVLIGTNGTIGWGFTTTTLDSQDLFIEKLDPTNPNRYVTPDGTQPFVLRDETIKVRGGADVQLKIRETRHGPVVSDLVADGNEVAGNGHVLALSAAILDGTETTADAMLELNVARDWQQFQAALTKYAGPMQNIVYADVDGNIGFTAPGRIPIRRAGNGFAPVPGWTGEYDWAGYVPFQELPRSFNPPSGMLVNANARNVPADYPHFISREWSEPYRQERAAALLRSSGRQTPGSMVSMQADSYSPETAVMLPLMMAATASHRLAPAALDLLRGWDGRMLRDRPEPLIYSAWLRELHREIYADELGEELFRDYRSQDVAFLLDVLRSKPAWCDDVRTPEVETCPQALGAALDAALDYLEEQYGDNPARWRWGKAHHAYFRHRIFDFVPLLRNVASVSVPVDGGMHTLNRARPNYADTRRPFAAIHGAGLRMVLDFDNLDRSLFSTPLGQSGNILSSHYNDLTEGWRDFSYITIYGRRTDLGRRAIGSLWLSPK